MSSSHRHSCRAILIILIFFGVSVFALSSCAEPSPLYGTWADNKGNNFSFFADNTFSAKILSSGSSLCEGNFSLLMNVITLTCTNIELRIVTEWDIRGNILYLDWIDADGVSNHLSLYKISN